MVPTSIDESIMISGASIQTLLQAQIHFDTFTNTNTNTNKSIDTNQIHYDTFTNTNTTTIANKRRDANKIKCQYKQLKINYYEHQQYPITIDTNKMQHKYKQNVIINKIQSVKENTNTTTEYRLMLEHQL